MSCERHGLRAYDASRSLAPGSNLTCTATVTDRSGPHANATVLVLSEAGHFVFSGQTGTDGTLRLEHRPSLPLPLDVDPGTFTASPVADAVHTGTALAPEWLEPQLWKTNPTVPGAPTQQEPRRPDPLRMVNGKRAVNNPRDNLVTFIVVTEGEESFQDLDGDGFDPGEPFVDTLEPFVDADDDGTWSPGEDFIDSNGNGQWDGRNGTHDASTHIWAEERIVWTGLPADQDVMLVVPGVSGQIPTVSRTPFSLVLACPGASTCSEATTAVGTPQTIVLTLGDPWFNAFTHADPNDACELQPGTASPVTITSSFAGAPLGDQRVWPSPLEIGLDVKDARTMPSAPMRPPLNFRASLVCRFTGWSNGPVTPLFFDAARGTTE